MSDRTVSVLRNRDDRVIPVSGVYQMDVIPRVRDLLASSSTRRDLALERS